jgi:hypothetical protein
MQWAKRELSTLQSSHLRPSPLNTLTSNLHTLVGHLTPLVDRATGRPTPTGHLITSLLGVPSAVRTRQTLARSFTEFLTVLEDAINSELSHASRLFALFTTIDHQFLSLQRSTVREADTQDLLETELLSSLWTRVLGANAATLRKYEKNRLLLRTVRERTVGNKNTLVEHNGKLMALKQNLEMLRRKLVSPLVRGSVNDSSGMGGAMGTTAAGVADMIHALEGAWGYLKGVREWQRGEKMEVLYGVKGKGSRPPRIGAGGMMGD